MYWYLATPYTKFPGGLDEAEKQASYITARYVEAGVPVFSPIVYGHTLAKENPLILDPCDLKIWRALDAAMIAKSCGLIVVRMNGWLESKGVQEEIETYRKRKQPILYVDPGTPFIIGESEGPDWYEPTFIRSRRR